MLFLPKSPLLEPEAAPILSPLTVFLISTKKEDFSMFQQFYMRNTNLKPDITYIKGKTINAKNLDIVGFILTFEREI